MIIVDLEELHNNWLIADSDEEEAYDEYDRQDEWYELEISSLIHNDNMPRTKAEAKVQTEQIDKYKEYRELKRKRKRKLKDMGRKKSKFYKERDLSEWHKLLDIEASR